MLLYYAVVVAGSSPHAAFNLLKQNDIVNLFYTFAPDYSFYPPRTVHDVMAISYKTFEWDAPYQDCWGGKLNSDADWIGNRGACIVLLTLDCHLT